MHRKMISASTDFSKKTFGIYRAFLHQFAIIFFPHESSATFRNMTWRGEFSHVRWCDLPHGHYSVFHVPEQVRRTP